MKSMSERCPFKEGSTSRKLFMVLAKFRKPMKPFEVAKVAKVTETKAQSLLWQYRNPMHLTPLLRQGISKDGAFWLSNCKADPDAKRPARGKPKSAKKKTTAKTKGKSAKKPTHHKSKKKNPNTDVRTNEAEGTVAAPVVGQDNADWGKGGEGEK